MYEGKPEALGKTAKYRTKAAGLRQAAQFGTKAAALEKTAKSVLEEELEESSVTSVRQGLLPLIERIQKNPAMRVLIRKHGKPRAVLMSAQTYDALKKLANLTVEKAEAMSQEERIEAAYERLQNERSAEKGEPVVAGEAAASLMMDDPFATITIATPAVTAAAGSLTMEEVKARVREMQEKLRELDIALEI